MSAGVPAATDRASSDAATRAAHRAVLIIFALAGVAFAAWASRIADAKEQLDLSAGDLGTVLLFMSAGSLLAMPSTGRIVGRLGVRRTITAGMVSFLVGATIVGVGVSLEPSRWVVSFGLILIGLGVGVWDVSMNLEGAAVERLLGRTVMPRYHAAFSAGTVVSALLGAAMSYGQVPVVVHLVGAAVLVLGIGLVELAHTLPVAAEPQEPASDGSAAPSPGSAWLERRTLLIGFVVLAAAFSEGTANDWLAVAFVEGHGRPNWMGVVAFAVFLSFMTFGRILGTRVLDRFGRVPVLRATFALAVVGSLLVVFGGPTWSYAGAAIWGLGASLGFPVGMSASADDPQRAPARMSVVATIGYAAFIAGPPLLGFLGDAFGVLHSLLVVSATIALAIVLLPVVREPKSAG